MYFNRTVERNVQLEEVAKKQEDLERKIIDLTNVSVNFNDFYLKS